VGVRGVEGEDGVGLGAGAAPAFAGAAAPGEGRGDVVLEAHVFCEGVGAGERFVAFWHDSELSKRHSMFGVVRREHTPGRAHVNGFSPVWERMWEMSAKREVCGSPRRWHESHSHV
jgi:hypothetical protein